MAISSPAAGSAASNALARDTEKVLGQHLASFALGIDVILADYTEQSILITPDATYRGVDDIRGFFQGFLDSATPEFWAAFELGANKVEGEVGYITWWSKPAITLATDTIVVRDGKISTQTFTAYPG